VNQNGSLLRPKCNFKGQQGNPGKMCVESTWIYHSQHIPRRFSDDIESGICGYKPQHFSHQGKGAERYLAIYDDAIHLDIYLEIPFATFLHQSQLFSQHFAAFSDHHNQKKCKILTIWF